MLGPQQRLDSLGVVLGDHRRPAEPPLALGRLLLQDVAGEGVTGPDLAVGGQLEALLVPEWVFIFGMTSRE
jgi:hypothetical protein